MGKIRTLSEGDKHDNVFIDTYISNKNKKVPRITSDISLEKKLKLEIVEDAGSGPLWRTVGGFFLLPYWGGGMEAVPSPALSDVCVMPATPASMLELAAILDGLEFEEAINILHKYANNINNPYCLLIKSFFY